MADSEVTPSLAEVLEQHQLTDTPTWACERVCSCGENVHTLIHHRGHAAHVAAAVLASLELRQEWEVRTDGAYFGRHLTRAEAEKELAERKSIEAVVPHPTDWDRNPEIVTRWVGLWRPATTDRSK